MASLVLGVAGSALGAAAGGSVSLFGATLTAAQIGGMIGSVAGQFIDSALFTPSGGAHYEGPRLSDMTLTGAAEGAPIPRLWGRARVGGQLIWASKFKERATTTATQTGGGKGFGGGGSASASETRYRYSISFAVGLAEGRVARLGRVWADGKPLDLSQYTTRFYPGSEDQEPDPLIALIEGEENAPAFRGLAYLVFDDLPLEPFGNRIPQLQIEVWRTLDSPDPASLDNALQGVALIPGSGEFILATDIVVANDGAGGTRGQNKNNNIGVSDFEASIDQLQDLLPNCRSVVLLVTWFGDDLRCGQCTLRPKVELAGKATAPLTWRVNGVTRAGAAVVSLDGAGRPVFGGTPTDDAVVQAIQWLKARGYAVHLYPFILMDIPASNTKDNPYAPGHPQPAFPWRGRITCAPAPGVAGSVDKSADAASQVAAFFGNAHVSDFARSGTGVRWTGGADWGLRRMVLHYAHLCAAAGGVDAFLLASELEGLTKIRSGPAAFPAVEKLVTLADDVKSILPGAKISYAANWTEWACHRPQDGSGDVFFHLDPLWASPSIDFIAIDFYAPLADWRDGAAHLDYAEGRRVTDLDYLDGNIEGGEFYDWFYPGAEERGAQARVPIADPGGYGEPWAFRFKDIRGWWENTHRNRPGGVRDALATAWVPRSKPVWFTETGCAAIDKGANQPNVFVDAKSSESALPYYSRGTRDDWMQRRFLEAVLGHWDPARGHNPVSPLYGGPMIEPSRIHAWAWDARSFPDFPARGDVWTDTANWRLGHWLNGRIGLVALGDLVRDLCARGGFDAVDVSDLTGLVTGFLVERTMSAREALEPLMLAYQFDAVESGGVIKFVRKGQGIAAALGLDDLVVDGETVSSGFTFTRAQETDLPLASRVAYIDATADYAQSAVESRRLVGESARMAVSQVPIVMEQSFAQSMSDALLQDAWVAREKAAFTLAPSKLALDAGDCITLDTGARNWRLRLSEIGDAGARRCSAHRTDPSIYEIAGGADRTFMPAPVLSFGAPLGVFLDLPLLTGTEVPHAPYFAAYADPWPGAVMLYRAAGAAGFALDAAVTSAATLGALDGDFYSGPAWRLDRVNALYLTLSSGTLVSKAQIEVLNGANVLAVENGDGEWEIVQFMHAELLAPGSYKLSGLLRGLCGTEGAMRDPVAAGARAVVLDGALVQPHLTLDQRALAFTYRYGPAGADFSSPAYVQETRGFSALGLRPYAPAHLRGRRDHATGNWTLSWVRRTRIGGDDWEQIDVPLGEASEAYEVDIMSGGTVLRTLSSASPSVIYTAAQQISDFGAAQWNFTARVAQLSASFGRGPAAQALIYHH